MHLSGVRRARGLVAILVLSLLFALWQVGRRYVATVVQGLGPTLLAQAEVALDKTIRVGRWDTSRAGRLVVEDVRVSHSRLPSAGPFIAASRVELSYDPVLLSWGALTSLEVGRNTWATVEARDVRVWSPESATRDPVLSTRRLSTGLDLGPLLRRRGNVPATIRSVELEQPQVTLTRDSGGHWNLEPFFRTKVKRKPFTFRGEVRAHGCRVAFVDHRVAALPAPARNTASGDLTLSFAAYPSLQFEVGGHVDGPHGGLVRVQGHRTLNSTDWFASVYGESEDLAYWYRYFLHPPADPTVLAASGIARVLVWGVPSVGALPPLGYSVDLSIRKGSARLATFPVPVHDFHGEIGVRPGAMTVNGTGVAAGIVVHADGEVYPGPDLRARLRLTSSRVALAGLRRVFPRWRAPELLSLPEDAATSVQLSRAGGIWEVRGTATARIARYGDEELTQPSSDFRFRFGPNGEPRLAGNLKARGGRFKGISGEQLELSYRMVGGLFQAEGGFLSLGGAVRGRGWVRMADDAGPPQFYVTADVNGVDVSALPGEHGEVCFGGTAAGRVVVSGTPDAPTASAYVTAAPLQINDEHVAQVAGRVRWANDRLEIPYAVVSDPRFTASVHGSVTRAGELDLQVDSGGVDLATALAGRTKDVPQGTTFVTAAVGGSISSPRVVGRVALYNPVYQSYRLDFAETEFQVDDARHVQLSALNLIRSPARATAARVVLVKGLAPGSRWSVDTELSVSGLSIARAAMLAGVKEDRLAQHPLGGDLENVTVRLVGDLTRPAVEFRAGSQAVVFQGLDLGRVDARGSYDVEHRQIDLSSVTTTSDTLRSSVSGSIRALDPANPAEASSDFALNLHAKVEAVRLLPLVRKYAPEVLRTVTLDGKLASASGEISGTLAAPSLGAEVQLTDILVNDRVVEVKPIHLDWNPEGLLLRGLLARLGSGTVEAPYVAFLADTGAKRRPLLDRLSGDVEIRDLPIGVARQLLEDSPFFETEQARPLRDALAQWQASIRGEIRASATLAAGDGGAAPQTIAEALAQLRARPQPARAIGDLYVPRLEVAEGSQPPAELTSAFSYQTGRFDLTQLRLEREDGALVSVAGFYQRSGGAAEKMDFAAQVTGMRLSSLARLPVRALQSRAEALQPLDGVLRLDAQISGAPKAPRATFSLDVMRPVVAGLPFDQLSVRQGSYSAEEGVLSLDGAELRKAQPGGLPEGRLLASGRLPLLWPDLTSPRTAQRRLTVTVPEQSLGILNTIANEAEALPLNREKEVSERLQGLIRLFRQIAATSGRMDGEVTLAGSSAAPKDSGNVRFQGGVLKVEGLETEIHDFNATFVLDGNRVRVETFDGVSSRGGSFAVRGSVILGDEVGTTPHLDLTAEVKQFKFTEKKVSKLVGESFKGTRLEGVLQTVDPAVPAQPRPLSIRGDWQSPVVAGGLMLDNASLVVAFGELPERDMGNLPVNPTFNVRLLTGKSVWLSNPELRLKLEGALQVSNSLEVPVIGGDLHVTRGNINLPGMRLRNTEGLLRVNLDRRVKDFNPVTTSPVYIDLTANTTLRVQRSPLLETEYYDATFEIKGTPGQGGTAGIRSVGVGTGVSLGAEGGLTVTVRTDPPLPSSQIEALIRQQFGVEGFGGSGANVVETLGGQIEQAFAANVASALTAPIESAVQSALKLDIFSIDLGVSAPLRVRLGKRLFGNLFGTVTQQFNAMQADQRQPDQRQFELYYRITPQLRVGLRQEEPLSRKVFFFSGAASF